jgi:hypothetical protein
MPPRAARAGRPGATRGRARVRKQQRYLGACTHVSGGRARRGLAAPRSPGAGDAAAAPRLRAIPRRRAAPDRARIGSRRQHCSHSPFPLGSTERTAVADGCVTRKKWMRGLPLALSARARASVSGRWTQLAQRSSAARAAAAEPGAARRGGASGARRVAAHGGAATGDMAPPAAPEQVSANKQYGGAPRGVEARQRTGPLGQWLGPWRPARRRAARCSVPPPRRRRADGPLPSSPAAPRPPRLEPALQAREQRAGLHHALHCLHAARRRGRARAGARRPPHACALARGGGGSRGSRGCARRGSPKSTLRIQSHRPHLAPPPPPAPPGGVVPLRPDLHRRERNPKGRRAARRRGARPRLCRPRHVAARAGRAGRGGVLGLRRRRGCARGAVGGARGRQSTGLCSCPSRRPASRAPLPPSPLPLAPLRPPPLPPTPPPQASTSTPPCPSGRTGACTTTSQRCGIGAGWGWGVGLGGVQGRCRVYDYITKGGVLKVTAGLAAAGATRTLCACACTARPPIRGSAACRPPRAHFPPPPGVPARRHRSCRRCWRRTSRSSTPPTPPSWGTAWWGSAAEGRGWRRRWRLGNSPVRRRRGPARDAAGRGATPARARPRAPTPGRPRRADDRAQEPRRVQVGQRVRPHLQPGQRAVGAEGVRRLPGWVAWGWKGGGVTRAAAVAAG